MPHPRNTTRLHGTVSRYSAGCRCDECREAGNRYRREYRRRTASSMVSADGPRADIAALHDDGWSYRKIAREADLSAGTVNLLALGKTKKTQRRTARRLHAIRRRERL